MPQPTSNALEQFVRDDVIEALMGEGFTRSQAESGAASGSGVTFSELFKTSLNWLMVARRNGRPIANSPVPKKEPPMQTQQTSPKTNGHAPAAIVEKRCAGYKKDCGKVIGSRAALCSTCYANKKYAEKYSAAARGKTTPAPKVPKVAKRGSDRVEILDAAPPVAARVSLEVTEAQLNQFLVKLSLNDKQRLANHFLQSAEDSSTA
jgi:hypothetical protein